MNEDQDLVQLEKEWKSRFERFTSPEPTREQTLSLIDKIKERDQISKPADLRMTLEAELASQTMTEKMVNVFLSQWTFHGVRSWLLTGIVMLILTLTISFNSNDMTGFLPWIRWSTLIMIGFMGYAFRPKNEGNDIIEKLSYHPFIQQMFARFLIVMSLQFIIVIPMIFFLLGTNGTIGYIFGTFTPIFFFGAVGFVSTVWLGQKIGICITLLIWFVQMFSDRRFKSISLFQTPENEYFLLFNGSVLGISLLLLVTLLFRNRSVKGMK